MNSLVIILIVVVVVLIATVVIFALMYGSQKSRNKALLRQLQIFSQRLILKENEKIKNIENNIASFDINSDARIAEYKQLTKQADEADEYIRRVKAK